MSIYAIAIRANPGIYGVDDDGNPWSTFTLFNGSCFCDECGAVISGGYVRCGYNYKKGRIWVNALYVCVSHVRTQIDAHVDILTALDRRIEKLRQRSRQTMIDPNSEHFKIYQEAHHSFAQQHEQWCEKLAALREHRAQAIDGTLRPELSEEAKLQLRQRLKDRLVAVDAEIARLEKLIAANQLDPRFLPPNGEERA